MNKTLYNENSIESLDPREFTRLKPGVYCGDTTYATQLLVEILSNAVDEFRLGHGDVIDITIDGSLVSLRDYGQGFITHSYRDDGKTILEAAFSVLNTSGKYRSDGTYEGTSLGSFGIGSKITNYLSSRLDVATCRDGKVEHIVFLDGLFSERHDSFTRVFKETNKSGTFVEWRPDPQFFTHPEVEVSKIKELLHTISCLCPGLTINLLENGHSTTYFSQHGLDDLVDAKVKDTEMLKQRFHTFVKKDKYSIDFILTYVSAYTSTVVPYVNTGLTEKGPHISMIKSLVTREFNKFFRDQKWLKEKDENLTGDDIQEGSYMVFNITAPDVAYDAQVKSTVTKIEMHPFLEDLTLALRGWLESNKAEIKIIADKALSARKAREAAKKARDAVRKPKEKGLKAKMQLSDKFIDCTSKNPAERNLLLVEGTKLLRPLFT